jgi:hypothetical protein
VQAAYTRDDHPIRPDHNGVQEANFANAAGEGIDIAKVATMALADHDVSDAAQLAHAAPPPSRSQNLSRASVGRRRRESAGSLA